MKTIVTRLTPATPAAIATLGVAGPGALAAVERFVRLPTTGFAVGGVRFATWRIPLEEQVSQRSAQPQIAGEHVVLTRPAENRVEVHCHGGAAVCHRLFSDLVQAGCVAVATDQWPSQLSCPLARAAEEDLLLATTDQAAAVLLDQMNGALRDGILAAQRQLLNRESAGLRELLRWADFGLHLSQPWKVVLAGPPNVGKSSLLNALAGTRQAIVHHEPGTTRDWLQWPTAVDGWPVVFTDTAGVRQSPEAIERMGVELGLSQLRDADLAVLVIDAQLGWTPAHTQMLPLSPQRRLIVYNKMDLKQPTSPTLQPPRSESPRADRAVGAQAVGEEPTEAGPAPLWTSAVDGTGIDTLLRAISRMLVPETPIPGAAIPFRAEQVRYLSQSWHRVQAGDWVAAAELLSKCLGEPAIATLGAKPS